MSEAARKTRDCVAALLEHADETEKQARGLVLELVELEARKLLARHPNLDEFVMGTGDWYITRKQGSRCRDMTVCYGDDAITLAVCPDACPAYAKPLEALIERYEKRLHITSESMAFTAKGPKH